MTPPPNPNLLCEGCFLAEQRDGRVCPAARDVHGLPDVEAHRHAQALHDAILADAGRTPGFAELVHRDAASHTGVLPAAIRLGLLIAPSPNPLFPDAPRRSIRVTIPSCTPR
jgi:hypothetical protein